MQLEFTQTFIYPHKSLRYILKPEALHRDQNFYHHENT